MRWHGRRSHNNHKTVGERGIVAKGEGGVIGLDEANPKVPEVHLVQPTEENLSVIARDCSCRLYLRSHLHFITRMERPVMEEFTRLVVDTGGPAGDECEYDRDENRRNDNHPPFFPRSSSKCDGGNNNINSGSGTPLAGRQREELRHSQDVDAIEIDASLNEIHEGIRQLHELALRHREEVRGHGDMLDVLDGRADHSLVRTTKAASKVERFSRRV